MADMSVRYSVPDIEHQTGELEITFWDIYYLFIIYTRSLVDKWPKMYSTDKKCIQIKQKGGRKLLHPVQWRLKRKFGFKGREMLSKEGKCYQKAG